MKPTIMKITNISLTKLKVIPLANANKDLLHRKET